MEISLEKIRADVRARVNDEQGILTDTLLTHWANISQEIVYTQLFPILEPKMTGTKIEATAVPLPYLLPSCRQIRRVLINGKKAKQKRIDEIDSMSASFGASAIDPAYIEWAGKIEVFPVSITNATIRIDYLKNIALLELDSDISILPQEYHGLIIDYAEMLALRKLNRGDQAVAAEQTIAKLFNDILGSVTGQIAKIDADKERT